MIRVFRATDTVFTTNGEVILKPIDAVITKTDEEEYIVVESPLKYADFLLQENILIVDTLTGKKGYRIHNPVASNTITVKAWLFYQENVPAPSDRGVVIAHGKNLENCEVAETWDDVVTKLIPIGYNGAMLPEGYLSVVSPYQKVYEKTIEFELTESLETQVEALEETIDTNGEIEAGLKNSVVILQAKYTSYDTSIATLQTSKTSLQQRLSQLGISEPELKEKAVIEAQLPLIDKDIAGLTTDKATTLATLNSTKADLIIITADLVAAKASYSSIVITDLRTQAQKYLNVNKFPQINYDLEAHLEGIVEVGDTIKVKHPDIRVDILTNVTAYELDCLIFKFKKLEFGTAKLTLKTKLAEVEKKIEAVNETTKKNGNLITKYASEYKRDNEGMVSKFTAELYGMNNGIYGMIEKNSSILRQTASEISGTVSRINSDLSTKIASLTITADAITAKVAENYTALDGKIASNSSTITQTATAIRSEVSNTLKSYSTTTQMTSVINQTATSITSSVTQQINGVKTDMSVIEQTANKINWLVKSGSSSSNFTLTDRAVEMVAANITLTGYVTINALNSVGAVAINAGNITAGGTITGNTFTNGAVTIDNSNIVITAPSGFLKGKSGGNTVDLIGFSAGTIYIGANTFMSNSYLYMKQKYITIGYGGTSYGASIKLDAAYHGFYGANPVGKQTVNKVYTATTLPNLAARFNDLLTKLDLVGMIEGSGTS